MELDSVDRQFAFYLAALWIPSALRAMDYNLDLLEKHFAQ